MFSPLLICREYILVMGVYLGEITHCSVLTIDPITSWKNPSRELVVFREMNKSILLLGDFSGCWLVGDVAVLGGPGWLEGCCCCFILLLFVAHVLQIIESDVGCCSVWSRPGNRNRLERIEAN